MLKPIWRWLDVYEDEIGLFLWTTLLLVLVRSSGMILNNYAETTFLKRYGVEFMPVVNMVNAGITFVVMGAVAGLNARFSGAYLLARQFLFCGASVLLLRFAIPLGFPLVYPALFVLKALYEVLLALFFWNLANDLYNIRQSKRLFPLMTAGGVVGLIISSFGTPLLAELLTMDNLLFVYVGFSLVGAAAVRGMSRYYPSQLLSEPSGPAAGKRGSMIAEIRAVVPLMRREPLLKFLVLLTFLPNVLIPIMNYQFNFAIDGHFASEASLLWFFGYLRGTLNVISLFLLLFVSRIYGRWGLPVALLFHPFNYTVVLLSFLLRFDVFTAVYARLSANIIRTTINIPAMAVLTGTIPKTYRNLVRPFLRGTVVRIGLFLGSGFILLSEPLFHPRYLSLVALPFGIAWIVTPLFLKRRYAGILLKFVAEDMVDLGAVDTGLALHAFKGHTGREELRQVFAGARGAPRLWYAGLLRKLGDPELDGMLITAAAEEDDDATRAGLVELISDAAGEVEAVALVTIARPDRPLTTEAVVKSIERITPNCCEELHARILACGGPPEVIGTAAAALLRKNPEQHGELVRGWLASADPKQLRAGIIAAGRSRQKGFTQTLEQVVRYEPDGDLVAAALDGLRRIDEPGAAGLAPACLVSASKAVRLAALVAIKITDRETLRQVIPLLGDPTLEVSVQAQKKIEHAPYHDYAVLIESLNVPHRHLHKALLELLETMEIREVDVARFVREQAQLAYQYLNQSRGVENLPAECDPPRTLLADHLRSRASDAVQTALRILGSQDAQGRIRTLRRGLFSADDRKRANAVEALGELLSAPLAKVLLPLVEGGDVARQLAAGRRFFSLPESSRGGEAVLGELLASEDWVAQVLGLHLAAMLPSCAQLAPEIARLRESPEDAVRAAANNCAGTRQTDPSSQGEEIAMQTALTLPEKILLLRKAELFSGLEVGELAAVAAVAEEQQMSEGQVIFREGETGDTMYLIDEGEVVAVREEGEHAEMELERFSSGVSFGEAVLFDDLPRSATVRADVPCRMLVIHKREIEEIVREFPNVALHACKVMTARVRDLESRVSGPLYCRI